MREFWFEKEKTSHGRFSEGLPTRKHFKLVLKHGVSFSRQAKYQQKGSHIYFRVGGEVFHVSFFLQNDGLEIHMYLEAIY